MLYERYEGGLYAIANELDESGAARQVKAIVGDVTDTPRLDEVLQREMPHIIFHAAAHKHVPMMELNPCEAATNNVGGTWLTAAAADRFGVEAFVLISSDKAVNPTSVMGATKRVAEMVIQGMAARSATTFTAVRFGNVLGSSGSVIPTFLEQIKKGGPVTVTHKEVRRYFMLTSEAVQLVMQAAAARTSGSIYVLEIGEQIPVIDMARSLIRLAGLIPDTDVEIAFTGLRPGEKMYEELVGSDEKPEQSGVDKILRVNGRPVSATPHLFERIGELRREAEAQRPLAVIHRLCELVPAFTPDAKWHVQAPRAMEWSNESGSVGSETGESSSTAVD